LTQFRVIVTYLRLMFFPVNQNLDYDYPTYSTFFTPPVYLSFLLLAAIFAFALWLLFISRSKADSRDHGKLAGLRLIAFGILWFFLTLSVESSLIPIRDLIMEHRLYLPFFGISAALATAFFLLVEKLAGPSTRTPLLIGSAALVLVLAVTAFQRNHVWGDPVRLWKDVASKSPGKARPVNNLGMALENAGDRAEAMKTFARAIKLDPTYYKAYYNLADLHLVNGQPEKSLPLLQTAIELKRDFTEAYVAAGAALMRSGRFAEVISFLERYRDIVADNAEAHFYLGASYAFLGDRAAAMRELKFLSRRDPQLAANLRGLLR
jgi:tetratricopeptide (TPR) repeat protein